MFWGSRLGLKKPFSPECWCHPFISHRWFSPSLLQSLVTQRLEHLTSLLSGCDELSPCTMPPPSLGFSVTTVSSPTWTAWRAKIFPGWPTLPGTWPQSVAISSSYHVLPCPGLASTGNKIAGSQIISRPFTHIDRKSWR